MPPVHVYSLIMSVSVWPTFYFDEEKEPLEKLSNDRQLSAFKHDGFWQPMDTLREKEFLEELWQSNKAPWKIW